MALFYLHGLLFFFLLMVTSGCQDITAVTAMSASQEENAVLPCFTADGLMDLSSCYRIKWTKCATGPSQMKVILARPTSPSIKDADRAQWEKDGNGQMALHLTKVQKSDEGLYRCEIWHGWDSIIVKHISLKVKECKTITAVNAVPSTRANLNCPVEMKSGQQGPQEVSWTMLKGGTPVPVTSGTLELNGTSLAIQSVKYNDSGWYRCNFMLGQTQRCFEVNLQVQMENVGVALTLPVPTTMKEGSSGIFSAVIASAIFAIGIIAALIALFIYRRRTTQRVVQQTTRPTGGTHILSADGYEVITFMPPEVSMDQQFNSLHQQDEDESMFTFQYN